MSARTPPYVLLTPRASRTISSSGFTVLPFRSRLRGSQASLAHSSRSRLHLQLRRHQHDLAGYQGGEGAVERHLLAGQVFHIHFGGDVGLHLGVDLVRDVRVRDLVGEVSERDEADAITESRPGD